MKDAGSDIQKFRGRYTETTRGIRISVVPQAVENESDPVAGVYTFSYDVTIENLGTMAAQLIERHWIICSNEEQIAEVVGPGVVGKQPRISPEEAFQYQSSAVIQDAIGSMHGSYTFRTDEGEFFEVQIPKFDLVYAYLLH